MIDGWRMAREPMRASSEKPVERMAAGSTRSEWYVWERPCALVWVMALRGPVLVEEQPACRGKCDGIRGEGKPHLLAGMSPASK